MVILSHLPIEDLSDHHLFNANVPTEFAFHFIWVNEEEKWGGGGGGEEMHNAMLPCFTGNVSHMKCI